MFTFVRVAPMRGMVMLALVAAMLLGAGCFQKDTGLTLRYAPVGRDEGLCSKAVGIGTIRDSRGGQKAIGDRDAQVKYFPLGAAVSEWVHDALAVEFKARGCATEDVKAGSPFNPDYMVSGEVFNVYLSQTGMLGSKLHMKMRVVLDKGGEHVFQKTYEGAWERTALNFSQERNEALFQEALGDLLRDMVPEILGHVQ